MNLLRTRYTIGQKTIDHNFHTNFFFAHRLADHFILAKFGYILSTVRVNTHDTIAFFGYIDYFESIVNNSKCLQKKKLYRKYSMKS